MKPINNFAREISELSENVRLKESEISEQNKTIVELNSLSKDFQHKSEQLETKAKENAEIKKDLKELKSTLEKQNKTLQDRDSLISNLKMELSETREMKNEYNSLKNKSISANSAYDELKTENRNLSEKIKNLKHQIAESEEKIKNLSKSNNEFNKLKSAEEKYRNSLSEKDKIIKQQEERFESLKLTKSAQIKAMVSKKNAYEEEIKKKDIQINELIDLVKHIQNSLGEKNNLNNQHGEKIENQYEETIENQVQKIAELEQVISDSKGKSNGSVVLEKENYSEEVDVLEATLPQTEAEAETETKEQVQPEEEDTVYSKSKLITSKSVAKSMLNEGFEHFEYLDVQIINVNLPRATMDVVSTFNGLMQEVISKNRNRIIVNLSKCEFIDSSIVGVLVSGIKKATAMGGDLRLVGLHPAVRSMMEFTRMHRIFESFQTIDAAVASFE